MPRMLNITTDSFNAESAAGYHRIASFMSCPQKFAYRYLLRIEPRDEPAGTGRGTIFHEAAAAYYRGLDWRAAIDALPRRYYPYVEEGAAIFEAYLNFYAGETLTVLDVEVELVVRIKGRKFTRRVDLVTRGYGNGKAHVKFVDHKLAARMGERVRTAAFDWSLATQHIVGVALCQQRYGLPFRGVELNLAASDGSGKFRRERVLFSPRMLATIPRSLDYYYGAQEEMIGQGLDPHCYPRTGECFNKYGRCDYLDLCKFGETAMAGYGARA